MSALVQIILGFDSVTTNDEHMLAKLTPRSVGERYLAARAGTDAATVGVESRLLSVFADLAELLSGSAGREAYSAATHWPTAREFLQRYLKSLDVEREHLPDDFVNLLRRVLEYYGVTSLEVDDDLREAVFRLFLVQQRWPAACTVVGDVLGAWSDAQRPRGVGSQVCQVLDRLVVTTQRRFPAIADMARSIRFRWFDEPSADAEQVVALAQVPELLAHLDMLSDGPGRHAAAEELIGALDNLVGFLNTSRGSCTAVGEPLLEILAQRHYRSDHLTNLVAHPVNGRCVVTGDYVMDGQDTHRISSLGRLDQFTPVSPLAAVLAQQVAARAEGQQAVVDLYLTTDQDLSDLDALSDRLRDVVDQISCFRTELRRITVVVVPLQRGKVAYLTFRTEDGCTEETRVQRGVHPMVGRRLNLWRLTNFNLTGLEARDTLLLLDAVAKDNPADERLIALVQVRRLSIVRNENGQVVGMPRLERALIDAVETIRRARAQQGGSTLDNNHVWLHVWGR